MGMLSVPGAPQKKLEPMWISDQASSNLHAVALLDMNIDLTTFAKILESVSFLHK